MSTFCVGPENGGPRDKSATWKDLPGASWPIPALILLPTASGPSIPDPFLQEAGVGVSSQGTLLKAGQAACCLAGPHSGALGQHWDLRARRWDSNPGLNQHSLPSVQPLVYGESQP